MKSDSQVAFMALAEATRGQQFEPGPPQWKARDDSSGSSMRRKCLMNKQIMSKLRVVPVLRSVELPRNRATPARTCSKRRNASGFVSGGCLMAVNRMKRIGQSGQFAPVENGWDGGMRVKKKLSIGRAPPPREPVVCAAVRPPPIHGAGYHE